MLLVWGAPLERRTPPSPFATCAAVAGVWPREDVPACELRLDLLQGVGPRYEG